MAMNDKLKELVAVGASITANCQPCLQYHTDRALEAGADPQEVAEAIEVGKTVRRGAAGKMNEFITGFTATLSAAADPKSPCCGA